MKKLILGFVSIVLLGATAQAGIILDPYLGYAISGSNSSGSKVSGSDMGVRLGFNTLGFGLGLDATLAGTYKYENNGVSGDMTPSHLGVFVSYAFPVLVRAYGTYFVNSKISDSTTTVTGNGTKIGVQFTGLPFIAVGVEIYNMNYTDVEISGLKASTSGTETQTRLAISAPFYF